MNVEIPEQSKHGGCNLLVAASVSMPGVCRLVWAWQVGLGYELLAPVPGCLCALSAVSVLDLVLFSSVRSILCCPPTCASISACVQVCLSLLVW